MDTPLDTPPTVLPYTILVEIPIEYASLSLYRYIPVLRWIPIEGVSVRGEWGMGP